MRAKPGRLLVLALTLFFAPAIPVAAVGGGDYPPPAGGDWTITQDTWVENETIYLGGDLTVQRGNLSLENVTLIGDLYNHYVLVTVAGGAGMVADNCTFVSNTSQICIYLRGVSKFRNCTFEKIINGPPNGQIYIENSNFSITNSIVEFTLDLSDGVDPEINSTVVRNISKGAILGTGARVAGLTFRECGIGADAGDDATISDCDFIDCMIGASLNLRTNVSGCSFSNASVGITYDRPRVLPDRAFVWACQLWHCEVGIFSGGFMNVTRCDFRECEAGVVAYEAIDVTRCNFTNCTSGITNLAFNTTVVDCVFDQNSIGIESYCSSIDLSDSTFIQNGSAGGIDWSGCDLTVSNCNFHSMDSVYCIAGEGGNITVSDTDFEDTMLAVSALDMTNGTLNRCVLPARNGADFSPTHEPSVVCGGNFELRDSVGFLQGNYTPLRVQNGTCRAINVSGLDSRARVEPNATLEAFWYLDCRVSYGNGSPASGATVHVADRYGTDLLDAFSEADGKVKRAKLREYSRTGNDTTFMTPMRVNASLGNLVCNVSVDLDRNLDLGLVLTDVTAPVVEITYPAQELLVNTTTIEITGRTEPGCTVLVNGEAVPFYLGRFSATVSLQEGPNLISVVARDAAGNVGLAFVNLSRDSIPPALSLTVPQNGAVTNSSTTAVSGTTEPGARVYVNDAEAVVAGPFFWANVTLSEGNNTLSIRAVDPAGNSNSLSMRVFLDTVPPSLAVDPAEGALTPMAIYPLAGSTEPGASVTVNGVLVTVGPDGRFRTNLSLRLGQNTIHLISCDAAGNTASLDRNITREAEPVPRTPSTPSGQSGPGNLAMAAVAIVLLAVLIPIFLARRRPRAPEDRDDISSGPRPEGREP